MHQQRPRYDGAEHLARPTTITQPPWARRSCLLPPPIASTMPPWQSAALTMRHSPYAQRRNTSPSSAGSMCSTASNSDSGYPQAMWYASPLRVYMYHHVCPHRSVLRTAARARPPSLASRVALLHLYRHQGWCALPQSSLPSSPQGVLRVLVSQLFARLGIEASASPLAYRLTHIVAGDVHDTTSTKIVVARRCVESHT